MTRLTGADSAHGPQVPRPMPFPRLKWPETRTIAFVGFWVFAFGALINLPGLISILSPVGPGRTGVPGTTRILAAICVAVAVTLRFPIMRALGAPGFFFLATIALHNIIGTAVSTAIDPDFTLVANQKYRLLGMLIVAVAAAGFAQVAGRIGLDRFLQGLLAILIVVCLFMLLTPALVWYYGTTYGIAMGRVSGTLSGPNHSAVIACLTLSLASALITWRGKSALSISAICVAVPAIVLTASRTGMLLLIVVTILHVVHSVKRHGAAAAVLPSLIGLAVLALITWTIVAASDSFLFQYSTGRLAYWQTNRPELWGYGLALIRESPIVGNGIDTLVEMEGTPHTCWVHPHRIPCGVHMQYLMFLGEAGILPFVTFLLFFASAFARCPWPPTSLAKTVSLVWTICFALYGLGAATIFVHPTNFFVIGIICGLLSVGDKMDRQTQSLHKAKPLE